MIYTLKNEYLSYSLDEKAFVVSVKNLKSGNEYCVKKGELFRLIYQYEDYYERSVNAAEQKAPSICLNGQTLNVKYDKLTGPDGELDISLSYSFVLSERSLTVTAEVENNSPVCINELQTTAFSGIGALCGDGTQDNLLLPSTLGVNVPDPIHNDLYKFAPLVGRKYERPDQIRSYIDVPYPGVGTMQWFSLYNAKESIYVGNHDAKTRILSLHIERNADEAALRLGVCQFPFIKNGESYVTPPLVYAVLEGDWHSGAKLYRSVMENDFNWNPPIRPKWAQEFQGWLRVIFRTQSGEFNYHFSDIPRLFDQLKKVGLNTLFILGWPQYGFARMRPNYWIDPKYIEDFKNGVDYVHKNGGKVVMFVSYTVVDKQSDFFLYENGDKALLRNFEGDFVKYSETYSADATYRRIFNLPKDQYCSCSGSDQWHKKMQESAKYCLSMGADAVLFDLGATRPLLCFDENHDHSKPNETRSSRAARFADLRRLTKEAGEDKSIMQEHCIDVFAQHMDVVQPNGFKPRDLNRKPEMFRYTFPEIIMTNRESAMDETNLHDNINYSFIYGLAYDLSIFRCAGAPEDIPRYSEYLSEVLKLRKRYEKYFSYGKFVDEDGFDVSGDSSRVRNKAYLSDDGNLGVAVWNNSDESASLVYKNKKTGITKQVTVERDAVCFIEL